MKFLSLFHIAGLYSGIKYFRNAIILLLLFLVVAIISGVTISIGGLWSRLLFISLGVSASLFIPVNWLVFGAMALYQGFPLEVLDGTLLPETDINFRLSDLLLLLIFVRSITDWLSLPTLISRKIRPHLGILILLFVFLLWAFLSSFIFALEGYTNLVAHMTSLGKVMLALSPALYLVFLARRHYEVDLILKWMLWWGIIQCVAGLCRWLPLTLMGMDWVPTQIFTYDTTFWLAIPSHPIMGGLATITGFFGDPAKLGYWLVVALWAKVYFLRRKGGKATRGDSVQLGLLLLGLIATSRRGALIALTASVLAYLVVTRNDVRSLKRVFRITSLAIVAGILVLLLGIIFDPFRPLSEAFRITSDPNYGFGGRLDQSFILWRDFLEKPISGFGWMGNSLAGKTFWAASNYIFILADLGIIGFSLLLMLIASTLYQCRRNMRCFPRGSASREIYVFTFISFISIYAAMLSDIILIGGQPTLLLFGICFGITSRRTVSEVKQI